MERGYQEPEEVWKRLEQVLCCIAYLELGIRFLEEGWGRWSFFSIFIQNFICVYMHSLVVYCLHIVKDFKSHYFFLVWLFSTNGFESILLSKEGMNYWFWSIDFRKCLDLSFNPANGLLNHLFQKQRLPLNIEKSSKPSACRRNTLLSKSCFGRSWPLLLAHMKSCPQPHDNKLWLGWEMIRNLVNILFSFLNKWIMDYRRVKLFGTQELLKEDPRFQ